MPRVVRIGSANVDYAVALPRLPRPGETVSGGELLRDLGGKGANQAVAARRLGAEVRFIGAVGADSAGEEIRARLAALGIGVEGLVTVPAPTGTALIFVDAAGANQIAVAPGANHALSVAALAPHAEALAWAEVVVCQLELPLAGGALGAGGGAAPRCRDHPQPGARPGSRRRAPSPRPLSHAERRRGGPARGRRGDRARNGAAGGGPARRAGRGGRDRHPGGRRRAGLRRRQGPIHFPAFA